MNIFKRELKSNLKVFLFWSLGLFVLDFAGMTKFTGMEAGGAEVMAIFDSFPKIVLALFGMTGVDPSTLSGYFSVMSFFTMIITCIYAISLGINSVSREAMDKTYEFVFTKPRRRSFILFVKLSTAAIYLLVFCVLNYIFSVMSIATLKLSGNINTEVMLFCLANVIIGVLFFSIAVFLSAIIKESEKGAKLSNLIFMVCFIIGVVYDILDNPGILAVFAPLKYFKPSDLVAGKIDIGFLILCIVLITGCIVIGFKAFEKKDLSAT